jgi:GntR family transcriptional regulator/MocR family aminotransferase
MGLSVRTAGLAILLELRSGAQDTRIAREATAFGLAPSPLSGWYGSSGNARSGLLLGVTTVAGNRLAASCERLRDLIDQYG